MLLLFNTNPSANHKIYEKYHISWNVVGREEVWRVPVHRCIVMMRMAMRMKNVYDKNMS